MKGRANGQGHHPKVRQPFPNLKKEVHRIMVMRKTPLKAWQLAMMRLGISFERQLKPFYSVVNDMAQEEMICVGIGFGNAEAWYVDSDGYCMLQANDAEPPPKNGILRKALQCAAVFFLSLMVLIGPTSCNKDPQPTPVGPTPIDTITPVNPDDTIVPTPPDVPWDTVMLPIKRDNSTASLLYPSIDTIQKLIDSRRVVKLKWCIPPNLTAGWTPGGFSSQRDSLKVRFAISDKIFGEGRINVNKNYGGQAFRVKIL